MGGWAKCRAALIYCWIPSHTRRPAWRPASGSRRAGERAAAGAGAAAAAGVGPLFAQVRLT